MKFINEETNLFGRNVTYGLGSDADWQWTMEENRWGKSEVVLLGAALQNDRNDGVTTLQVRAKSFYDDEHDRCHILNLSFANFRPVYGYKSISFEAFLVSGSWYTDPETLTPEDMFAQHGRKKNRDNDGELCSEVFKDRDGDCGYQIDEPHYAWLPYTAPTRLFTPRKVELRHGPVVQYALGNESTGELLTEPTRFWNEIDQKSELYQSDDNEVFYKYGEEEWSAR